MADWLKDFMGRTPFAILGAIGLLSMASQFINLADDIENWLKVWKAVTRPVWEWIAELIGWKMPNWLKDILTAGVIHLGMLQRASNGFFLFRNDPVNHTTWFEWLLLSPFVLVVFLPAAGLYFPAVILFAAWMAIVGLNDDGKKWVTVYVETLIYLLIALAINGALIVSSSGDL